MSPTRRWHRVASAVLLIAAGAHFAQHAATFVGTPPPGTPERAAAIAAMQAYVVYEPLGTTLWTVLGAFSLAHGAALAMFGASQWILARETDPRTLRRHALRNALLLALAEIGLLAWHPQPQLLFVFGACALLYAVAAWPREFDV